MLAELGLFALIIAGFFSALLLVVPTLGLKKNNPMWIASAKTYLTGQCCFVLLSYVCLTWCFLRDDFTVRYVLAHSSTVLPWFYKLCAVWGGHEGSMLLWVLLLSGWAFAVRCFSRSLEAEVQVRVLVVLGALSFGFILFLLTTSNPFLRQFELINVQGRDLNPLLQDIGFLFHPPVLYMGYVGFSVAFAFAIAGLWIGTIPAALAKWTRPWTLAAWCCLTLGITLGSWWAYRELGWGGWWFWDPVENASFMPWLIGTALIHSLIVTEKKQQFQAWTLLLAITAFALSLIGTFLVRSGVLTSVHAFAVDPARGLYILIFLAVVIGGALGLLLKRGALLQNSAGLQACSRESLLLLNNVFLMVATLTILLGTLFPLLIDGLGLGKLSVGAPYFNGVFTPLGLPLLFLMGAGIYFHWQRDTWWRLNHTVLPWIGAIALLVPMVMWFFTRVMSPSLFFGCCLAVWVIVSTLAWVYLRFKQQGWHALSQSFLGMVLAHLGVAISVLGMVISSEYGVQSDIKLAPGEQVVVHGFSLDFIRETAIHGPNFHGRRVAMKLSTPQQEKLIYPEKRLYDIGQMPMTEAAIDVSFWRDIYVALGEPLDDAAWSVRVYYKPLVRWIWGGGFLIFCGGLFALTDRRYRRATQPLVAPV